jgi:hypothetical protein
VERADGALWLKVLQETNPDRKALVEQVGVCVFWGGGAPVRVDVLLDPAQP